MGRANTLSLATKILAVLLVLSASILSLMGYAIDMGQIIAGAGFVAGSFITVDISKIKTSSEKRDFVNEKGGN